MFAQLADLALADVGRGIDLLSLLAETADDTGAGGGRQAAQLVERVVAHPGPVRQSHADEKGFFETDRYLFAVGFE